jgi:Flp pilus assembly protein TadG
VRSTTADGGSATAEFVVALPAVVIVLAACLGAVQLVGAQVRVQDAASQAARSLARGDDPAPALEALPGARLAASARGDLECATVSVPARALGGIEVRLSATGCALGGGL